MHIFLTGNIGIGKSMVLQNILHIIRDNNPNIIISGFYTAFDNRTSHNKKLHLLSATSTTNIHDYTFRKCTEVVEFSNYCVSNINTCRFDRLGTKYLMLAEHSNLIIMDECGRLEENAKAFQSRVLELISQATTPIIGVIPIIQCEFTKMICNSKNAKVIEVTIDNRDELPKLIYNSINLNH